jgi:hypothetical protein
MAPLCAEFGISRKTGYKIFDRYKAAAAVSNHPTAGSSDRQLLQPLPLIQ